MILKYFDFITSMLIAFFAILLVCAIISLLAWRSIGKIPMDNLRERLACAVQYSLMLIPCLYVLNMGFQDSSYFGELSDFDTPQRLFKIYHTQIESLKIAHYSLQYSVFFGSLTFLQLLRIAVKAKN